jgi:capsular polysaccharide biosynthesis protein
MTVSSPVIQLISQYKTKLLILVGSVSLFALLVSLLLPDEYMSQASILPANSKMMDKQRLFSENIQELYSAYGNSEDLDRLFATMRSKEVLNVVADSFRLINHYKLDDVKNGRTKAYKKFWKNIELAKTEYGEIRIRVWDKDSLLSARIANAIVSRTREVSDKMFTGFYEQSISRMMKELSVKSELVKTVTDSLQKRELNEELAIIRNRMTEYRVTQLNPPPSLFILEKAEPSPIPDKPKILLNVVVSFIMASFCSLLWLAFLYARKWS